MNIKKGDVLKIVGVPDTVFIADGTGFGCDPRNMGNAVFGKWKDTGSTDRVERYEIETINGFSRTKWFSMEEDESAKYIRQDGTPI